MHILSPIAQITLTDTVTDRLREAIVRGELESGERLTEPTLASMLGVSRSPVREALRRLENEGLVVRDNKNGYSVWNPTEKDVDEILSLRMMMESLAAELIIENLSDEDVANLESIFEMQKQAIDENRHLILTKEDRRFHDYLIERSNHARLLEVWNRCMGQWEILVYRRINSDPEVSGTVLTDHKNLLDAIKTKDLERLIQLHSDINKRVGHEMKKFLSS
jgi:DNA-binding GntR family transcriptional regulator